MNKLKSQTCCFTGHRDITIPESDVIIRRLETLIPLLIRQNVRYFGVGGALGFDMLVTEYLLSIKSTYPYIRIIQVLPFPGYRSKWSKQQQDKASAMDNIVDASVYCYSIGSREAYLGRDERLVNESAYCIAYCKRSYGGTSYTMNYARQRNLQIYNLAKENYNGIQDRTNTDKQT